jgi:NACalpha-BTF3-like transcription factor
VTHPDDDLANRTSENVINSILSRSYEMLEDFGSERPEGISFHGDEGVVLPLFEEEDILCLMHRDAHFSGSFPAMREYYKNPDAKGVLEEIDPERIDLLEHIQNGMKRDLAPLIISGPNAERVALSKQMYKELAEVAEKEPSSPEGMLASAILSEDDIDLLVEQAPIPLFERPQSLLLLATSELLCDPLFPGYGTAPSLAIQLLGKMKYEPAIAELFQLIGRRDFLTESVVLEALRTIGPAAKRFAMNRLSSMPMTADSERAALVLIECLPDPEITALFSKILADPGMTNKRLKGYLSLGLDGSIF